MQHILKACSISAAHAMAAGVLACTLVTVAKANSNNASCIEKITGPNELYAGLPATIKVDINHDNCPENSTIMLGLRQDLNEEDSEFSYFSAVQLEQGKSGRETIEHTVDLLSKIESGQYTLFSDVIQTLTSEADSTRARRSTVVNEEISPSSFILSNANSEIVAPTLPSLDISLFEVVGDQGYVLSKSKNQDIRVNIQLRNRNVAINQEIKTEFRMEIPNQGIFPVSIINPNQDSSPYWTLSGDCETCATLSGNEEKGTSLTLQVPISLFDRIQNMSVDTIIKLHAITDPDQNVEEWQNNKSDNTKITSLLIIE